jgi:predicted ATPase/Tfp pilus assembly protein PilF
MEAESHGNPFVGRTEELEQLMGWVGRGGGLITLTGPAGMGKTALARRLAQEMVRQGRVEADAVVFCDLSQAWTEADIVTHLSSALGAHLSGADSSVSTIELLGQAIAGRGPVLLILDNFEQLVDLAAQTVSVWRRAAPEAVLLVTSRDRLRLTGEACLALPPLPEVDAVALFRGAAQAVQPAWAWDPVAESAVRALVIRLDGIPLAIELAAARSGVMSPQRMLDRIDKRFSLLGHGPSDGVARQATLRAAIDWSWELLSSAERSGMSQCSIFRGGFSLDAAEAVVLLDGDEDVLDVLESLHRKSMIRTERVASMGGELSFVIYESIREYAAEHVDQDEAAIRDRHAQFYVNRGEAQIDEFGSPEGTDLGWLNQNRDNLVAVVLGHKDDAPLLAARAALCLAHAQIRRGPYDSLLDLLALVPSDAVLPHQEAARMRMAEGICRSILGQNEVAHTHLQAALAIADEHGLDRMSAKALLHLGLNQLRIGQLSLAQAHLSQALERSKGPQLERVHARALASMGMTHEATAGFAEAERCYEAAGTIARAVGDGWEEARSRSKMGTLCSFMQGRQDEARGHLEWALQRSLSIGDQFIAATTSYNLGRLELNLGNLEQAEEHLCHALTEYRDMANRVSEGFVRMALGLLHLDRGATGDARDELELALDRLAAISHPLAQAFCEITLAMVDLTEGDPVSAHRHSERAREALVERKHAVLEGVSACVCGLVALVQGDAAACMTHRDRAQECLSESGWGEGVALLAVVDAAAGESAAQDPDDVRYARARVGWRIIAQHRGERSIAPAETNAPAEEAPIAAGKPSALVIDGCGRWFRMPGQAPVDLTRKRTLRPMLLLLAEHRVAHPGEALDVDQIFEGVWVGERAMPRARKNRVYVSIATLRKMGLGDQLKTRGDGYLLHPELEVCLEG